MELFGTRADVTRFLKKSLCAVDAQKLFKTEVYQLMAKEILSSAEPRIFLCMLACLENLVVSSSTASYLRLYAWWICLQHWGTL